MNSSLQGTLVEAVSFKGKGLHTGKESQLLVHPAQENTGIVFRRVDNKAQKISHNPDIPASWQYTKKLPLCTCLAINDDIHVRTIEHLMAAFYACGIDNALVEVKGSEIPVYDGSSQKFIDKINQVGIKQQTTQRKIFKINKTLEYNEDHHRIKIEPAESLSIDITIHLKAIGKLNWVGEVNPQQFQQEFGSARTFGRLKNGLLAQFTRFSKDPICLGANTKSAVVVVKGDQVLNKGGLRMKDEYVRHRMLDLVGDLMLSGGHIQGKITAYSPAHRITHGLLKKIFTEHAFTDEA